MKAVERDTQKAKLGRRDRNALIGFAVFLVILAIALTMPYGSGDLKAARRAAGLSNAKQLGIAVLMYREENGDRFPPEMSSARIAFPFISRYAKHPEILSTCDENSPEFLGVSSLAGIKGSSVKEPERALEFFGSAPDPRKTRLTLFVDGHAKYSKEPDFQAAVANDWVVPKS